MTAVSTDDVRQLAVLSSIALSDQEIDNLRTDIENILSYVTQLSELDTEDVDPTYQVTGLSNVWRDDAVDESAVTTESLLALAPEAIEQQIKVPKVL